MQKITLKHYHGPQKYFSHRTKKTKKRDIFCPGKKKKKKKPKKERALRNPVKSQSIVKMALQPR